MGENRKTRGKYLQHNKQFTARAEQGHRKKTDPLVRITTKPEKRTHGIDRKIIFGKQRRVWKEEKEEKSLNFEKRVI